MPLLHAQEGTPPGVSNRAKEEMRVIHGIVQRHIDAEQERSTWTEDHRGILAVSEIGHCPRKAMLRLKNVEETDPFDAYVRRLLWSGKMAERKLEAALHAKYGDELRTQVWVTDGTFKGKPDCIIPGGIVEHKETSGKNFKFKRLPYRFHCLQVLAYKHLYKQSAETTGAGGTLAPMDAWLYYQNRADHACFRVWESDGSIIYEGDINGKYHTGEFDTTLADEMEKLAVWYREDKIAPRHETPFEINLRCMRLYKRWAYPGCTYWRHCWPEHADVERLEIPENKR
jgi:hypothetical protein